MSKQRFFSEATVARTLGIPSATFSRRLEKRAVKPDAKLVVLGAEGEVEHNLFVAAPERIAELRSVIAPTPLANAVQM